MTVRLALSLAFPPRLSSAAVAASVAAAVLLLGGCERRSEPPKPAVSAPAAPSGSIESPDASASAASSASKDVPPPSATLSPDSAPSNGAPPDPAVSPDAGDKAAAAVKAGGKKIVAKAADATDKVADVIDDSVVTGKVKAALLADASVKGLDINVETHGNVVTLSGNVDSRNQVDSATQIAQRIDGVKQVNNNLKVKQ
ncbi:MAG: BON domain-containing protein [Burkholderiaceae bacterium]